MDYTSLKRTLIVLACLGLQQTAIADSNFAPSQHPVLAIERSQGEIKIDGDLHDPGWANATGVSNFVEHYPGDQTQPPVSTEVYTTFDENNLYVAFVCHDNPDQVRASYCERDKIYNDDNVRLCLDTYGNAEYAYLFYVNPYGIQGDAIWSSSGGEVQSYDLIWESAGIVTDSGYQVEIAIPFATLRFPKRKEQSWRVDFWRNHPRETKAEYSWATYDRDENCWPCQWGTVTGIAGVQPGRGIEVTPSLLAFRSGELKGNGDISSPYRFDNDDLDGEPSLWLKYTVSSNTTVEATVNPDFSQIESDAGQIDVNTTFALYYPEQRPFFQEGSDLFRSVIRNVYTRSINEPEFAVKATMRGSRTSVAYMLARDRNSPYILPGEERSHILWPGKSTSNILRIKHAVGEGSQIGLIMNDQRFDDGGNATAFANDALFRITPSLRIRYHLLFTRTSEFDDSLLTAEISDPDLIINDKYTRAFDGESYWGYFIFGRLRYWTGTWNTTFDYQETNPTLRLPNGLFRQTSCRYLGNITGYSHRLPSGLFETINPHLSLEGEWNYDGRQKYRTARFNVWTRLRFAQASLFSTYLRSSENFGDKQFDDIWHVYQDAELQLSDRLRLIGSVTYGHQIARRYLALGKNLDLSLEASIKPHDRVLINQSLNYARSKSIDNGEKLYDGYIYRARVDYQVSSPLSARLIIEYNDFYDQLAVDPLLTYRVNAFSVLYLGMTSNYQRLSEENFDGSYTESNRLAFRQFFAKLQYLFQL